MRYAAAMQRRSRCSNHKLHARGRGLLEGGLTFGVWPCADLGKNWPLVASFMASAHFSFRLRMLVRTIGLGSEKLEAMFAAGEGVVSRGER